MLKKILEKLLRHRHPWRDANFNELSEIYLAMLVRGMSLSMSGLFVPIFLIRIGFSLTSILLVYVIYFATRIFADIAAAYLVAKYGPKHVMVIGQILFSISSFLFLTLQSAHWPLVLLGSIWGASQSCFFLSFDVDFSKIKHSKHSGKELGYVEIMSRIGAILGPLLGGAVSLIFGPKYIFGVSTILLIVGLIPLFKTREPTHTNQILDYKNFPIERIQKHLVPVVAVHLENTLSIMVWPLFLGLFVLPGNTVYLEVGILSSISVLLAILAAHSVGRLVDVHKGLRILRFSVSVNTILHLLRPFVSSYMAAFGIGIVNDIATVGYRLPFFKAYYDQADHYPGHRIVFLSIMESFSSAVKCLVYAFLAILSTSLSSKQVLTIAFCIAAVASFLIMSQKFKALQPES